MADESRTTPDKTGGWFVPKNAMSEQEMQAAQQPKPAGETGPLPSETPVQTGAWYTPPNAIKLETPTSTGTGSLKPPEATQAVEPTVEPMAEPTGEAAQTEAVVPTTEPTQQAVESSELPSGAAISSEADYSNYIPGRGFVSAEEAKQLGITATAPTETASTEAVGAGTEAQPAAEAISAGEATPVVQADSVVDPASVYTPTGQQPAVQEAAQEATAQEAAPVAEPAAAEEPVKEVNPELIKRYVEVEKQVQVLRRKYNAGTITRQQLQDELRKLMILDEEGFWWMIGMESDKWYRYDGKEWLTMPRPGMEPAKEEKPAAVDPLARAASSPASSVIKPLPSTSQPSASQPPAAALPIESDTPLPQRVPIHDPGATVVGAAAPRLETSLKAPIIKAPTPTPKPLTPTQTAPQQESLAQPESASRAGYFDRASKAAPKPAQRPGFDGGMTVPSTSAAANLGVTQPTAVAAMGVAAPGAGVGIPARPVTGPGGITPHLQAGEQPNYGEAPTGLFADRQRAMSCVVQMAIVGLFLGLIGVLAGVGIAVFGYFSVVGQYDKQITDLVTVIEQASQSGRILDKDGKLLFTINDPELGTRTRVQLKEISPIGIYATIRTEDKFFYENPGFDPIGIIRAVLANVTTGGSGGGASSITQQLARALVLEPGAAQDRSARRKINEIIVASEISRRYTKTQILEFYLNTVYYGNLAYGIEAASKQYFEKPAKDLTLPESAFLAGLIQAPAAYDPLVNRDAAFARMDDILALLQRGGCIQMEHEVVNQGPFCVAPEEIDAQAVPIAQLKIRTFKPPRNTTNYPHFVNYVQQLLEEQFGKEALYKSGFTVYTTFDPRIQDIADQSVKTQIRALRGFNANDAAVLAMNPQNGAILAMVGSADFNNSDPKVRGQFNVTLAPRQPGSSIKPFVYLASFERAQDNSYYTPATVLWDVPSCFGGSATPYCPKNYDSKFRGPVTARAALANSYNIPAVKVLQYVGIDHFKQVAGRVGITFPQTQPEQAGLAMALGGVEVRMIDMVRAYGVLANGGKRVEPFAITKITQRKGDNDEIVFEKKDAAPQQVVEQGLAYLVTSMLSDTAARQPGFGNALNLSDGRIAAVKTGTTNDSRDNWAIGYTPQLVVGVWVGNADNSPMFGTSGVTGAAPIWREVMVGALKGQPNTPFNPPPGIAQATTCADFGTLDYPECLNRRPEIFFQPNPPAPGTNAVKIMEIDSFTGLLPVKDKCDEYRETRTFVNITDETAIAWLNGDAAGQKWAQDHKITLPALPPPTQSCNPNEPRPIIRIDNLKDNDLVSGLVEVRGSVYVPQNFDRYQIEVSNPTNPAQFDLVYGPVKAQPSNANSFLGGWDTTGRPNGTYVLRIFAVDTQGRNVKKSVTLTLNSSAVPTAPVTQPTQPPQVIVPTNPPFVVVPTQPITVPTQPIIVPTQAPAVQPTAQPATQAPQVQPTAQPGVQPTATQRRSIFPPTNTPSQ